jgi:hypothetical protein
MVSQNLHLSMYLDHALARKYHEHQDIGDDRECEWEGYIVESSTRSLYIFHREACCQGGTPQNLSLAAFPLL